MAWDRDIGDEPEPAIRDQAPDVLVPIDPEAPVGGHHAPSGAGPSPSESPEHDWASAASRIMPLPRPAGSAGTPLDDVDTRHLGSEGLRSHAVPVIDAGPAGLTIAYAIRAGGFDVLVNPDHMLGWGIEPDALRGAAMENLGLWSASAAWTDEADGGRRILSSDTGDGADAARILLPEVRRHLCDELGGEARVLVGLPERHLLVAGTLQRDDPDFARLFADFVGDHAGGVDEPIDARLFELVDGELQLFAP
jgi:hypothetical protein